MRLEINQFLPLNYSAGVLTLGTTANVADFPNAKFVASNGNALISSPAIIGVVGEAASDGSSQARGFFGKAVTSGALHAAGGAFYAGVANAADAGLAIGITASSTDSHTGGDNVAIQAMALTASSSGQNIALDCASGDIRLNNLGVQTANANTFMIGAIDLSAGNTQLDFYGEGTCIGTGTPAATRTIAMRFNGVQYYVHASLVAT